jgi:hypothetical protein
MFGFNADNSGEQVGELVERLKSNANLDDAQAKKVLETIKDFIVEKYPMLQGAIDNMLGSSNN